MKSPPLEAELENAVSDAAGWLEVKLRHEPVDESSRQRMFARVFSASSLAELEGLRADFQLGRGRPPRDPIADEEWWPAVHNLASYLGGLPDVYAGRYSWRDTVLDLGFTRQLSHHTRVCRQQFAFPSRIYAFAADFSLRELNAVDARVGARFDELIQEAPITGTARDVLRNRVVIYVARDVELFARRFREEFGPAVFVEFGEEAHLADGRS